MKSNGAESAPNARIASVHIPKTAGASVMEMLQLVSPTIYFDNKSPMATPEHLRNIRALANGIANILRPSLADCVHGHFLPTKYLGDALLKRRKFIVYLRDPIERQISHYYFWKRKYHAKVPSPLWHKMMKEEWTLEQFILSNETRNFLSQYLWGFPIKFFSFVGLTENFEDDTLWLQENILGNRVEIPRKNTNPSKNTETYEIDEGLRFAARQWHEKDLRLYNKVVQMRKNNLLMPPLADHFPSL